MGGDLEQRRSYFPSNRRCTDSEDIQRVGDVPDRDETCRTGPGLEILMCQLLHSPHKWKCLLRLLKWPSQQDMGACRLKVQTGAFAEQGPFLSLPQQRPLFLNGPTQSLALLFFI